MKLIDSHAHLDDKAFNKDRDKVLERIKEKMDFVVNIGCDLESSQASVDFSKKYEFIYSVVGVHPIYTKKYNEELEKKIEEFAKDKKVLAIGEIGLDYHWMTSPKEEQQTVFKKQLELARKLKKPVVIHTRDAMKDTIDILNEYKDISGILHCYPGSVETALQMIDRFYLGIGGVITFKNGKKLVEVVKKIPLEKLIIETDCPYMAPTPYRGERNEPIFTEEVAKKIAEIKKISYDEVVKITNENTRKAYKML